MVAAATSTDPKSVKTKKQFAASRALEIHQKAIPIVCPSRRGFYITMNLVTVAKYLADAISFVRSLP